MNILTERIVDEITCHGADLVAVGNLLELPENVRCSLPIGISIAVKYPKEVIRGIAKLPTQEYKDWYDELNKQLDRLVTFGAAILTEAGYKAIAQTREYVGNAEAILQSALPHKTVATRAGMGWIGKCALLVTENYGSMVRLSSILTDAPLITGEPINQSKCGNCMLCANACPAGAVTGKAWAVTSCRNEIFDAVKCRDTARERSKRGFGGEATICGKCIEICPYTQRYINE